MASLSTPLLVAVFAAGAAATWIAGVFLSKATDALDARYGLGDALGGVILLAIAGTLPEIAITVSAARAGHLDLAVGNLIGGVAVQTLVLVVLDLASGPERPLSFLVGSLLPVIEALIVMVVLGTALGGAVLSPSTNFLGGSPTSYAVVVIWLVGVWVVNRARTRGQWRVETPAGATPGRHHRRQGDDHPYPHASNLVVIAIFLAASVVTLVAGVALQDSGSLLAGRLHMGGAVFGATVLAFATALPEISSGIAAVKLGDMQLAVSDILGGNSFQITLLLLADLIAGTPVIVAAHHSDVWLGAAGMLMTGIAAIAVIARPQRTFLWLGIDSIALVAVYAAAIALLPK
ncbi:MAG: sodium:calcium antiporter [Actinobacteria bacterium]|nr:sodium:calcium antiporter [Actinomycetota bacterium]MBV8396226.1 sodium:calcium antiporter [Actinomycetota bacterium]